MGKAQQTTTIIVNTNPPPPNTSGNSQLMQDLLLWIQQVPGIPAGTNTNGTMQMLTTALSTIVRAKFQQQFGYPYLGASSVPPQQASNTKLMADENFYDAQASNTGAVTVAIQTMFQHAVPSWCEAHVISDISAKILAVLQQPNTNSWQLTAFSKTYSEPSPGTETFQADTCWVYCTADAVDPQTLSGTVETLFLYSIGTGYLASSWGLTAATPQARKK